MTDIEAEILKLFATNRTVFLTVQEAYNLLYPTQGHGIQQVRRVLETLTQQGILFREVRGHGLRLYRLVDPIKDRWWLMQNKELYVPDKVLQDYAQRLLGEKLGKSGETLPYM